MARPPAVLRILSRRQRRRSWRQPSKRLDRHHRPDHAPVRHYATREHLEARKKRRVRRNPWLAEEEPSTREEGAAWSHSLTTPHAWLGLTALNCRKYSMHLCAFRCLGVEIETFHLGRFPDPESQFRPQASSQAPYQDRVIR